MSAPAGILGIPHDLKNPAQEALGLLADVERRAADETGYDVFVVRLRSLVEAAGLRGPWSIPVKMELAKRVWTLQDNLLGSGTSFRASTRMMWRRQLAAVAELQGVFERARRAVEKRKLAGPADPRRVRCARCLAGPGEPCRRAGISLYHEIRWNDAAAMAAEAGS